MWKEFSYFGFYFSFSFLISMCLSLNYATYFLLGFSNFFDEGLTIQDSTIWVWAIWRISFFICFCLNLPYILILSFYWIKNWNRKSDVLKFQISFFFILYTLCISMFVFSVDLFDSVFTFPNITNFYFEFQPDIEIYLNFLNGLFFDLFQSLLCFQIVLFFGLYLKLTFLHLNNYIYFLQIFTLILFLYWFAGDGTFLDFWLCFSIFIFNQILIFSLLFFKNLRAYKKQ